MSGAAGGTSKPMLAIAAGVALVLAGGGGAYWWTQQQKPAAPTVEIKGGGVSYQPPLPAPATPLPAPASGAVSEPSAVPATTPSPGAASPALASPLVQTPQPVIPKQSVPQQSVPQQSTPKQSVPQVATPQAAAPQTAPAIIEGLDEARDRYSNVMGKVSSTEQLFNRIKQDLEAKGLSIRADSLARVVQMKMNLEQAKGDLDRGNVAGAMRNLSAAEAQAAKVNKEFGR